MKIYYTVQRVDDEACYVLFLDNQELALWDQMFCEDSLGYGELILESDSKITNSDTLTVIGYYLGKARHDSFLRDKFLERFLPDGLPYFDVRFDEEFYYINVDGICHFRQWGWEDNKSCTSIEGCVKLEKELNEEQK